MPVMRGKTLMSRCSLAPVPILNDIYVGLNTSDDNCDDTDAIANTSRIHNLKGRSIRCIRIENMAGSRIGALYEEAKRGQEIQVDDKTG